jgi:hypothetical protein
LELVLRHSGPDGDRWGRRRPTCSRSGGYLSECINGVSAPPYGRRVAQRGV